MIDLTKWVFACRSMVLIGTFLAATPCIAQTPASIGGDFQVNTYTVGDQGYADADSDASGAFVVVWTDDSGQSGALRAIQGQRFAADRSPIGGEFQVSEYPSFYQHRPAVAVAPDGEFVVAWQSFELSGDSMNDIRAQRFSSDGERQGSDFLVNTYTTGTQTEPSLSMNGDGAFVVAWTSSPGGVGEGTDGIRARRYASDGSAQSGVIAVNVQLGGDQVNPATGMDGTGAFVIAWTDRSNQDGSSSGIRGRQFDSNGAAIGGEIQLNTTTATGQSLPDISMIEDGTHVVVWADFSGADGDELGIKGQRLGADGLFLGGEFQVNTYGTGYQGVPSVAMDPEGCFVVAWIDFSEQDGSGSGIQAQKFDSSGSKQGDEFRVNSGFPGHQYDPSLALGSGDRFVVVWWDQGNGDGSGQGIDGRFFGPSEVFADGFESGALTAWSTALP